MKYIVVVNEDNLHVTQWSPSDLVRTEKDRPLKATVIASGRYMDLSDIAMKLNAHEEAQQAMKERPNR